MIYELLLKTKAELEKRGWCQNVTEDDEGHVCLEGALGYACGLKKYTDNNFNFLQTNAGIVFNFFSNSTGGRGMSGWNDSEGRTLQEVNNVLDDLIKRSKEMGV